MIKKIIAWFKRMFPKSITLGSYYDNIKYWNKRKLIDEIIIVASNINRSQPFVPKEYKRELRNYARRKLIKALINLKLVESAGKDILDERAKDLK